MSLPGGTVEASRAKRVQRQQARYRDRGGIFKPADHNPLLDLLLSRGVNGESPSRPNSSRPSRTRSTSPRRKRPTSHPQPIDPTDPDCGTNPPKKTRRSTTLNLTGPHGTVDDAQNELDDMSAPGTSTTTNSAPRKTRAPKPTKKSTRPMSSARAVPLPDPSDDESPPVARSKNSLARDNTPKSSKEKPSKPKQPRKRKIPPQSSVPISHTQVSTEHDAPATTSRKKAQKNATSSKSKVAVVAKLTTAAEGDGDTNPALARSRPKLNIQLVQSLGSDSEQPAIPNKSAKGKLKAISLEEELSPQVPIDGATAKKPTKPTKTDNKTNRRSDTNKCLTNVPETDSQASTSGDTKKRKKPSAQSTSSSLPSTGHGVRLDSDSEKQPHQSRSLSPEPPANEPARKRRKARQAANGIAEEQEPQLQNPRPSRQLGNGEDARVTRKVSRSKAPPIPMPNGIRLKPKPRPRLSMFQPPPDDDDNDHDPIDFLS